MLLELKSQEGKVIGTIEIPACINHMGIYAKCMGTGARMCNIIILISTYYIMSYLIIIIVKSDNREIR
jgi:hypothetical protein